MLGRGKGNIEKDKSHVGLDNIPIEVWKNLGDRGIAKRTKLFNKIMRSKQTRDV